MNWGRNDEKDENFSEEAATQSWIEDFQEADDGQQQEKEKEYYTTSTLRRNHLLLVVASWHQPLQAMYKCKLESVMLDSFCIVFFKTLATTIPLLGILRFAFNHPFQLQEPPTLTPLQYFVFQCFLFSPFNQAPSLCRYMNLS